MPPASAPSYLPERERIGSRTARPGHRCHLGDRVSIETSAWKTEHFLPIECHVPTQHSAVASSGSFCLKTPAIAAIRSPAYPYRSGGEVNRRSGELRGQGEPAIGSERQAACTRRRKSLHEAVVTVGSGRWIHAPRTVTTSSVSVPPPPFYSAIILTWRDAPEPPVPGYGEDFGELAVEVFFVSAVSSSAGRCRNRRVGLCFVAARFLRIFPNLAFVLVATSAATFFGTATLPISGRTPSM